MATTPTTPGVYVHELEAFPPSIVGVQTAAPAFIGYTEKAELEGKPAYLRAVKIDSLVDYETIFGKGPPSRYTIAEVDATGAPSDGDVSVTAYADPPPYTAGHGPTEPTTQRYRIARASDSPRYALYDSVRLFYANGGGPSYVISVGSYAMPDGTSRPIAAEGLSEGLGIAGEQKGPTMLVVPDAIGLSDRASYASVVSAMIEQAASLQDRVAILDLFDTRTVTDSETLGTVVGRFRDGLDGLTPQQRSYGVAYFPFVQSTVVQEDEVSYTNVDAASRDTLRTILGYANATVNWDTAKDAPSDRYTAVQCDIDAIRTATGEEITALDQRLKAELPILGGIESIMIADRAVLPPSGALAGIYTANDQSQGVWNAPANVSLASVSGVTYSLDDQSQGELNVPVDGKAIDAIRTFPTRGQVVWGARTLDGNSNDYRYVQVRRTLIYIEQSIKAALDPFVFAANDGKTWTAVVSMISGFLQQLWNQGGLMGATASEAFTVECGLGSTMTGQDILEGYMIVNVTLQMIRPAEFIELTFKQKMEGAS